MNGLSARSAGESCRWRSERSERATGRRPLVWPPGRGRPATSTSSPAICRAGWERSRKGVREMLSGGLLAALASPPATVGRPAGERQKAGGERAERGRWEACYGQAGTDAATLWDCIVTTPVPRHPNQHAAAGVVIDGCGVDIGSCPHWFHRRTPHAAFQSLGVEHARRSGRLRGWVGRMCRRGGQRADCLGRVGGGNGLADGTEQNERRTRFIAISARRNQHHGNTHHAQRFAR